MLVAIADDELIAGAYTDRRGRLCPLLAAHRRPTVHLVFSVQEEFNLRGAVTAAQALAPDIAIQLDLILATDTPDTPLGANPARTG